MGSGPNCPPLKSGKLGPGQLNPGAQLSGAQLSTLKKWQIGPRTVGLRKCNILKNKNYQENETNYPKCKQGCSQISNMLANIPNTPVKTQNISVQIANNHPKLHNHDPKCQRCHLNHQIPTPKSETSSKLSNSLSTIPDKPSRIQNAPPQSQARHQKYNVHHPKH